MTADEMFKELGCKKHETGERITYIKENGEIVFNKWLRYFTCFDCFDNRMTWQYITMEELKAINKKCEELKWI